MMSRSEDLQSSFRLVQVNRPMDVEMSMEELQSLFKRIIWEETYGKKDVVDQLWLKVPAYRNFIALKKIYSDMKKDYKPDAPEFSEIETRDKTYKIGDMLELYDPESQEGKMFNAPIDSIKKLDSFVYAVGCKNGQIRVKYVINDKPIL